MKKIGLKKKGYPYTFARVSVMKSKLLQKSEYQKLLRMRIESITQYLQDSSYKSAIDRLALQYSGIDLVEQSLNLDLVLTFQKLRRISEPEVRTLIDAYAMRWDMYNIKTIIRGIFSGSDRVYIRSLLVPVGLLDITKLEALLKAASVEEVLKSAKIFKLESLKQAIQSFKESGKLIEIENRLDQIYFENGLNVALAIGDEGRLFAKFLLTEIDIINIRNLMRMKREGFSRADTEKHLIFSGRVLNRQRLVKLAKAESFAALMNELKKTDYAKAVETGGESLIDAELELDKYLIKRSFLYTHQHPMSVMSILTYMMNKIIEVKNLKTLSRAKQLGIEDKYIEEKLIVM